MGKKSGKFKKKENNPPKKSKIDFYNEDDDMMNDAIDACKFFLFFYVLYLAKSALDTKTPDPIYESIVSML